MGGEKKAERKGWVHFVAGAASGCALVLAGHPFDTVKVRLQTAQAGHFKGPLACVVSTVKKEGPFALYKGVLPPLLMTSGVNTVLFGLQYNFCDAFVRRRGGVAGVDKPTLPEVMASAVMSGAMISALVTPMEGIKTRLQVDYTVGGRSAFDCTKEVLRSQGLRYGVYRGWGPVVLCRMSNYAYFGGYHLATTNGVDNSVLAGATAGLFYWLSCYPFDVVKARVMANTGEHLGMTSAAKQLYSEFGVRGFFRGFTPTILRAFPANAAAFSAYDFVSKTLNPA
eukprot:TRINITY_DN27690_c0_g1_i1.p1 TRINITY_DN27690_c0_g1~~TRINITY_DN27690_c0_g1_i1.p1  ORF type:complete len:282 (+),score=75.40 TRINITY_DN27690_c0_g1_i1:61-906(+)